MLKIKECNACYTGGGFYLFTGILEDGRYFVCDNECEFIDYLSEPFNVEDSSYTDEKWDSIFLGSDERKECFVDVLKWIINNKPSGNYQLEDIKKILSDFYKENIDLYEFPEDRAAKQIKALKSLLEKFQADTNEALETGDFSKVNNFKISYNDITMEFDSDMAEDNNAIQYALMDMIDTYKDYID